MLVGLIIGFIVGVVFMIGVLFIYSLSIKKFEYPEDGILT